MKKDDYEYLRLFNKALFKIKSKEGFEKACQQHLLRMNITEEVGVFKGPGIYMMLADSFPLDNIPRKAVLYLEKCTEREWEDLRKESKKISDFLSNKGLK